MSAQEVEVLTWRNDPQWLRKRIELIIDPYFEREFFTNLIYCLDRGASPREILEESFRALERSQSYNDDLDRALLHLLSAYQATSFLRESYQWLPLFQALYAIASFHSDAKSPIVYQERESLPAQAGQIEEFQSLIRRESRRVSSFEQAWSQLQFFLENRSMRGRALETLIQTALIEADVLTASLLMKSIDLSFACGWKNFDVVMKRPFERFWTKGLKTKRSSVVAQALSLTRSLELNLSTKAQEWSEEDAETLWDLCSQRTAEAAWEWFQKNSTRISFDQAFCALDLVRGRALYTMKLEQWPLVCRSLMYSSALKSAARWVPSKKSLYLASHLIEAVRVCQLVASQIPLRPTGESAKESLSQNLVKNQLVLRIDDACERGDRQEALALLSMVVKERGLTHSVSDRLVLMASKQDAWTYDQMTIPISMVLTQAYQDADRLKIESALASDALYGLLRFLSDQRQDAIEEARRRGHYDDGGLSASPFDVSHGARIIDRFVFNQLRNAQRIKIWPSEAKG